MDDPGGKCPGGRWLATGAPKRIVWAGIIGSADLDEVIKFEDFFARQKPLYCSEPLNAAHPRVVPVQIDKVRMDVMIRAGQYP